VIARAALRAALVMGTATLHGSLIFAYGVMAQTVGVIR
jgi:hypothetical protein